MSTVRWSILVVALGLAAVGAATIHSASSELPVEYLPRQALWVALGMIAFTLVFAFDYQRLASLALPFYGVVMASLGLVLVVGRVRGGAQSWLGFGGLQIQPAELAKLATALLLARYLAGRPGPRLETKHLAVVLIVVAMPMTLIALQPDYGSAAMFLPMLAGMLFVAGLRPRLVVAAAALLLVVGAAVLAFGLQDYQVERIRTFLAPGSDPLGAGYQVRQSKIAVGSGELLGRGYMQGTQSQLRFLPARHTDFVFAVLAEEWGFLGVAVVLGLYGALLAGLAEVASRARDRLGILLVVGLACVFFFHVVYNTAMVVGLVPITGIPLPFLSYGGSFTLFCFASLGLVLNVDYRRYVNR